jgi:hypothetical protein
VWVPGRWCWRNEEWSPGSWPAGVGPVSSRGSWAGVVRRCTTGWRRTAGRRGTGRWTPGPGPAARGRGPGCGGWSLRKGCTTRWAAVSGSSGPRERVSRRVVRDRPEVKETRGVARDGLRDLVPVGPRWGPDPVEDGAAVRPDPAGGPVPGVRRAWRDPWRDQYQRPSGGRGGPGRPGVLGGRPDRREGRSVPGRDPGGTHDASRDAGQDPCDRCADRVAYLLGNKMRTLPGAHEGGT